ncbi:hypothetical protein KUTeg_013959 [Tegillarca granosa]|uniref:Uncharacterized protein n=1 Tax=Tegillarca granosa TaxID=220873 RepID=A0ABQ9EZ01_TEGGR|nr:hypothetical protein KUTeg_013959 [Tegillarca granosa]
MCRIVIVTILHLKSTWASIFLGGTISWKSEGQRKVTFHEKLGFNLYNGPGCEIGKEGKYVSKLQNEDWKCSSGCTISDVISDVNYFCSSVNIQEQWEQGDKTFSFTFPSTGPFVVSYADAINGHHIQTTVDLRARSDIYKPNSSPITTAKPLYRFPLGCTSVISIPVSDPDGDAVKCRWANSVECGGTCQTLPNAILDEDTCTLEVDSTTLNGYAANQIYKVKITVEDKPKQNILLDTEKYTVSDTISSVPVQFEVHITQQTTACNDRPAFVSDTPGDQAVITSGNGVFNIDLYAMTVGSSTRIKEFVLSTPNGLTVSSPSKDDKGRPNIWYGTMSWSPDSAQQGLSIVCIEAVDDKGIIELLFNV